MWDITENGGTYDLLNPTDSMQQDLGPGEYWFHVVDDIGCMDTSINILVEEPPPILTTSAILTEAKCAEPKCLEV